MGRLSWATLYHRIMKTYDVEERRLIVVPANEHEANNAVKKYIQKANITVVGFDCEWNSSNMLEQNFDVAVIQISTDEYVILFLTTTFECPNTLPKSLRDVLLDRDIVKVGVGIEKDIERLGSQFYNSISNDGRNTSCCREWLDLRCLLVTRIFYGEFLLYEYHKNEFKIKHMMLEEADEKRASFMPKLGLETLVMNCLRKKLEKPQSIRFNSNWELKSLSEDQKLYAAADASASLEVFHALNMLNDSWYCCPNLLPGVFITHAEFPEHRLRQFESWDPVIEVKYDHTRIRMFCLNIIDIWDPSLNLRKYFGRYFKNRVFLRLGGMMLNTPLLPSGFRTISNDEFERVLDMIPHKKSTLARVFEWLIDTFLKVLSFFAVVFCLLLVVSYLGYFKLPIIKKGVARGKTTRL